MILSALQNLVAEMVGDPDQTRFGSARIIAAVNRAQEQFAVDSMALFKDEALSFAAGVSTDDLPTDFILEESVILDGLPLKPVSRHTLAVLYPSTDWTTQTGTPTHYMIDPEEAVKKIRVIPIPTEAVTGSLRYYPLPAEVSAGTDTVLNASSLMSRFHLAIASLAAWFVLMGEEQTPQIDAKQSKLMKVYNDGVTKAVDTYGNTKSEPMRIRPA